MENVDIKTLYLDIRNSIKTVESKNFDINILYEIKKNHLDFIELLKLFLISKKDTYYGYFLMNLKYNVDFTSDCIAAVELGTYPPVLKANPLVLFNFSLKNIIFIICHEIEHIILNHPAEMLKINPTRDEEIFKRFNYAADASVNDRILYDINAMGYRFMEMPENAIDSKNFGKVFGLYKVKRDENYLYYYNLIKKSDLSDKSNGKKHMLDKLESDNLVDGKSNNNEQFSDNGTKDNLVSDSQMTSDADLSIDKLLSNASDHDWTDENALDAEETAELIKEFVNETYSMMDKKTRGLMPSSFIEAIDKINEPTVINWQSLLKKYVGTISAGYRHTRLKLNRRQPERFDLSGKESQKLIKLIVAIDTSGSISNKMLAYIFNEIFAIISKKKYDMTVIECDYEIKKIYNVKKPSDVQLDVSGRGGTSFTPVIEYINNNRQYRDALLIYFTDGYGDDEIPKPKAYKVLWVLTGRSEEMSLKDSYGKIVQMEKDEYE